MFGSIFYIIAALVKFILNALTHLFFTNSNKPRNNVRRKYTPQERYQFLENQRIRRGYKKGWLYFRCEEEGLLEEYYKHHNY